MALMGRVGVAPVGDPGGEIVMTGEGAYCSFDR